MNRLIRLFRTSIGRKLVVAVTGLLLLGFLLAHLLGNLTILQGPDAMNAYAAWLQGHPLIWIARAALLLIFVAHTLTAVGLALENRSARPIRYRRHAMLEAGLDSRSILLTGLVVLAFLVYHLLHFTFGVVDAEHTHLLDERGRRDVYHMVTHGFRDPWIAGSYLLAMMFLGVHLIHGAKSMFQTLGINHESYNGLIRIGATTVVAALILGNVSIPLLVLGGAVRSPETATARLGEERGIGSLPANPATGGERHREGGS